MAPALDPHRRFAMKIEMSALSTPELLQIIAAAAAELQIRSAAAETKIDRREVPERKVIVVNEPSKSDQATALKIVSLLKRNGFVLSAERDQYREIVRDFPDWVKYQRIPSDVGGSVARRWLRLNGN